MFSLQQKAFHACHRMINSLFGAKLLWTLVSPSMLPDELDADINQPREEIPVDDELAPLCVEVGCWFGSYSFI